MITTLFFQQAYGDDVERRAKAIALDLEVVAKLCPQKIWAQENLKKVQVVLRDDLKERAWLWNNKRNDEFSAFPYKDLPDGLRHGYYGFSQIDGLETMAVALKQGGDPPTDPRGDVAFDLVVHESFHKYFQNTWRRGPARADTRGETYPADWKPRYLRRQVLLSLINAYLDPQRTTEYLGAASYWQSLLRSQFSSELEKAKYYDVTEGSANYIEEVSVAVVELGCNATEEDFYKYMKGRLTRIKALISSIPSYSEAETEYYQLGFAASLLLRMQHIAGWEEQIMDHTAPVDVVLTGISPLRQADDSELIGFIKGAAKARNDEIGPLVDPTLAQLTDKGFVRVSTPMAWESGSYSARGFIHVKSLGEDQLVLKMGMTAQSPDKTSKLSFKGVTVVAEETNICGAMQTMALLPQNEVVTHAQSFYILKNQNLSGVLKGELKKDQRGFTWICGKSDSL